MRNNFAISLFRTLFVIVNLILFILLNFSFIAFSISMSEYSFVERKFYIDRPEFGVSSSLYPIIPLYALLTILLVIKRFAFGHIGVPKYLHLLMRLNILSLLLSLILFWILSYLYRPNLQTPLWELLMHSWTCCG